MSREIQQVVRAVVGLAATVVDDTLQLPRTLPGLPVRVIGLAMQATMKVQQHYAGLVARGDEVFTGLRGEAEPGLATFDEDLPEPTAGRTSAFDRAPSGFDQPTSFDRASVPVDDEAVAEEVAALIDDEVSGLPAEPAPEEVVEALADITDEVAAAGLDLDRAEPGLSTEDALESALLEADGAPDSALVDGGTGDAGAVDTDEIAESPTTPPASLLDADATEFDVHRPAPTGAPAPSDPGGSPVGEEAGAPDVAGEVDVITPDGEVATVEGTVTDEGVAAPEAPAAETAAPEAPAEETPAPEAPAEETPGAPAQADRQGTGVDEALGSEASDADTRPSTEGTAAGDDRDATGSGEEVVTAAGAAVDDALGAGDEAAAAPAADSAAAPAADAVAAPAADDVVATDEGGTEVAAATGVRTDVDESASADEAADTAGATAAGAAPVEGYDSFTVAQLRGRLRGYQLSTVADLVAYEEATRAREPYLRMLRNRLEKLERQAVEGSPLAPRGA